MMTKLYLAGPDVFLPDALEIGRRKIDICRRHGVDGLYPLDNTVDLAAIGASLAIFRGNEAMMEAADAIIANLTPFRGAGADPGTAYELGYMAGRGKLCLSLDRHGCALVTPPKRPDDVWHDLTAFETCVRFAAGRFRGSRR